MKLASALERGIVVKSRANTGNAEDFATLYRQYHSLVRTVIFQVLGAQTTPQVLNDLTQEAFIKIWKGLPEFQQQAQLKSWIYRISVNTAIDSVRSTTSKREVFEFDFQQIVDLRPGVDEAMANRDIVAFGLKKLSEEHRVVLVLALLQELPLEEIATILDVSVGTVKSRLHYGKERFREILEQKGVRP